jgi:peroxiredoxin family protein
MELGKDTKLTLKLETIVSVLITLGMIVGVYFSLLGEIAIAKELPAPEVSRTEYDLKDQMIRDTIMNTQDDVEEIKQDVKNIERIILEMR